MNLDFRQYGCIQTRIYIQPLQDNSCAQYIGRDYGVRTHNCLTALFLQCFGKITKIKLANGKVLFLNTKSFEKWSTKTANRLDTFGARIGIQHSALSPSASSLVTQAARGAISCIGLIDAFCKIRLDLDRKDKERSEQELKKASDEVAATQKRYKDISQRLQATTQELDKLRKEQIEHAENLENAKKAADEIAQKVAALIFLKIPESPPGSSLMVSETIKKSCEALNKAVTDGFTDQVISILRDVMAGDVERHIILPPNPTTLDNFKCINNLAGILLARAKSSQIALKAEAEAQKEIDAGNYKAALSLLTTCSAYDQDKIGQYDSLFKKKAEALVKLL